MKEPNPRNKAHLKLLMLFVFICLLSLETTAQETEQKNNLCIIDNIHLLESNKDPKCHATASRLEDFMYGTPLNDAARAQKIELQKKLVLYIWDKASKIAATLNTDTINITILQSVFEQLNEFGKNSNISKTNLVTLL